MCCVLLFREEACSNGAVGCRGVVSDGMWTGLGHGPSAQRFPTALTPFVAHDRPPIKHTSQKSQAQISGLLRQGILHVFVPGFTLSFWSPGSLSEWASLSRKALGKPLRCLFPLGTCVIPPPPLQILLDTHTLEARRTPNWLHTLIRNGCVAQSAFGCAHGLRVSTGSDATPPPAAKYGFREGGLWLGRGP